MFSAIVTAAEIDCGIIRSKFRQQRKSSSLAIIEGFYESEMEVESFEWV
jgi:hypothetical protein